MSDRATSEGDAVAALSAPSLYPHAPGRVAHIQTHLSHVFVAAPFAYKLKRAVRYSFADFSTAELRRASCLDEVALNRRLCAPLYLGVLPLERDAGGALALGPPLAADAAPESAGGAPAEHVVWMRALPSDGMGRSALARGRIDAALLAGFAGTLARFHAGAPIAVAGDAGATLDAIVERWRKVLDDSRDMVGTLLDAAGRDVLADFGPSFVHRHASLLEARIAAGRVREGHGDLHLGNLCLVEHALPPLDAAPEVPAGLWAFDCIEFSRDLRVNDVASEVAFLAMDLEVEGRPDLARAFVAAYVAASGDAGLPTVLPLFVAHRAAIRGMVHGLAAQADGLSAGERAAAAAHARDHFALAVRAAWRAAGPAIVAVAGLSGSGKTTVAAAIARSTGFALLSSDEIRKRRAGLDPRARASADAAAALYSADARRATYRALADEADRHVAAGEVVVADATFNRRADRAVLFEVAARHGCPILFLDCVADEATARARLAARARAGADPTAPALSDADGSVRAAQAREREAFAPGETWLALDTAGERERVADAALRTLWAWRRVLPARALRA